MREIDEIVFEESPKTFMEILKVNNREVQFANALAFFFRPNEKHNLKTLFIDSLLNTKCSELQELVPKSSNDLVKFNGYNCDDSLKEITYDASSSIKVIVEQPTNISKRIDIYIETNTFIICIEFKINHDLDNPLENYRDFIVKEKAKNKRVYFLILTPYKKKPIKDAKLFFEKNVEFKQVILRHFFEVVNSNLVKYLERNNRVSEELSFFNDLAQTVKNREIRSKRYFVLTELLVLIKKRKVKAEYLRKDFIEIKQKKSVLKLRLLNGQEKGWNIESWNENKEKKILKSFYSKDPEEIVDVLSQFFE